MAYDPKKNKHKLSKIPPRFEGNFRHAFSVYRKDGDEWRLMAYSIATFEAVKLYVRKTGTPGSEWRVFERKKLIKHWRFPEQK
jgi:hypothetical protein